jgi:hypothetical protein
VALVVGRVSVPQLEEFVSIDGPESLGEDVLVGEVTVSSRTV